MPTPSSLRWIVVCLALLISTLVQASDGLDKHIQLLGSASDFRVRTQAALALGASRSERAVTPLCRALSDENRTVRIASATALSRLRLGGQACLKTRLSSEKDSTVVSVIKKALERLGSAGAEPTIGPGTKYYVAIDKLAGPARLDGPVRAAFAKVASRDSSFAFAPQGESQSEAAAALAKHKGAKGYLLSPKLSRPTYEGGVLQVKISIAMMTYPGNALIGNYSKSVGMQGITSEDTEAENELVVLVAEEAMKQFVQLAPSLSR